MNASHAKGDTLQATLLALFPVNYLPQLLFLVNYLIIHDVHDQLIPSTHLLRNASSHCTMSHTHLHTRTHTHTRAHAHTPIYKHIHNKQLSTHAHLHRRSCTHILTQSHTTYTHIHTHIHTNIYIISKDTHSHTHTHIKVQDNSLGMNITLRQSQIS